MISETEEGLVEYVRSIKSEAKRRLSLLEGDYIEVSDPTIIQAAWGPRRASSRDRGMKLRAYPNKVSAVRSVWERWLGEERDFISVVIAKKKAQARINAALGFIPSDPEMVESEPTTDLTDEEIEDMLAERLELRKKKMFEEADKIRDYLLFNKVDVRDMSIRE